MAELEADIDAVWQKRMLALMRLSQIRLSIQEEHGIYEGNLVEEARTERERQFDETSDRETTSLRDNLGLERPKRH